MRAKFRLLLGILSISIALFFIQCSSSSSSNNGGYNETNLTGNWSGTWSSYSAVSGDIQASMIQNGDNISGTVSIMGSPCISGGTFSGTVSGNSIFFGIVSETDAIDFTATYYSPFTISGTYSVENGNCAGDTGTFTLHKDINGEEPLITTLAAGLPYPTNLIVKKRHLFWSDDSQTPIKSMSLSDGNLTSVVRRLGDPEHIVINGQYLYWIGSGGVDPSSCTGMGLGRSLNKSTLDGTSSTVLAEGENCVNGTNDIVVDDTNVYWVNSAASPNTYTIEKVSIAGGESSTLVSTVKPIISMVSDDTHLYWLEEDFPDPGILKKMPLGGGSISTIVDGSGLYNGFVGNIVLQGTNIVAAELQYPYPGTARLIRFDINSGAATELGVIPTLPKKLAADDSRIYWADASSVNSMPVNGGSSTTLAGGLESPADLAVDTANVFWVETVCCAHGQTGSIKKVPVAGGSVSVLAEGVDAPQSIAVTSSSIYWVEGGPIGQIEGFARVVMMPVGGGDQTTIIGGISDGMMSIAVDDTHVYIADRWTIKKVAREGGVVEKLAIADFNINDIATDGVNVYWIEDGPFTKIAKVSTNGGTIEVLSNELSGPAGPIVLHGTYLYWMAHYDTLAKVSVSGGLTDVITDGLPFLSNFAVDGTHAYFSENDTGYIQKVSLNDGTITELIELDRWTWRILAVDDENLYWIDQVDLGKIPINGGAPTFIDENIQSDVFFPNSIAVDDENIYWTETGSGEINMATPK